MVTQEKIKNMSHLELARLWRFGKSGDPRLQGENGDLVKTRLFNEYGGFTPEISKEIGWSI